MKKEGLKMLNRALLVGRLIRDPELRRTGSGKAVTSFNLAVERNFKSDDQEADFINCVCWGKIAENTERYCSKGSMVSVDGRIQTRSYENNQGQKVYVTEVIADSVQFINTRRENQTTPQAPVNSQAPVNNYASNGLIHQFEDEGLVMEEDDIQF
jgi:single-strand DNA-binding protein